MVNPKQRVRKWKQVDLARLLGRHVKTIQSWRKTGKLKPAPKGKIWLSDFHLEQLLEKDANHEKLIKFWEECREGCQRNLKRFQALVKEYRANPPK